MKKLSAIIIKGNPKFIDGNSDADSFYNEIKNFLEQEGYEVSFDPGEPYTSPKDADLWIGHSRGGDRLRFHLEHTKTLLFGSSLDGAINHPEDSSQYTLGPTDQVPNKYHYVFTEDMKKVILDITKEIREDKSNN